MKIGDSIKTLNAHRSAVDIAASEAAGAVEKAQQKVVSARSDALDPSSRKSEPALGGLLKRVEDFDSAYTRIKNARDSDLRAAQTAATQTLNVRQALGSLVNTVGALTMDEPKSLSIMKAVGDLNTANAALGWIGQLRMALTAAKDSPVAQSFPTAQLDALQKEIETGRAALLEAHPALTTGRISASDLVAGADAKSFIGRIENALSHPNESPEWTAVVHRNAWVMTGEAEGPRHDAYFAQTRGYPPPPLDVAGFLRGHAQQLGRELTLDEAARALVAVGPPLRHLVLESLRATGDTALLAKHWPLDLGRDILQPATSLAQTLLMYDRGPVDAALRDAIAKAPGNRLTLDAFVDAVKDLPLNDAAVAALDQVVMSNPSAYAAFLPPSIAKAFGAIQALQSMTLPTTIDANASINKLRSLTSARDEELLATSKRQKLEGTPDNGRLRKEADTNIASFERGLGELQRTLTEALGTVTEDATKLRARIASVVAGARDAIAKEGGDRAASNARFQKLSQHVDMLDASLRARCDQLEQFALTSLTQPLTSLPALRGQVVAQHAHVLAQL